MEQYKIKGGRRIEGSIDACGSKNAALPILACWEVIYIMFFVALFLPCNGVIFTVRSSLILLYKRKRRLFYEQRKK